MSAAAHDITVSCTDKSYDVLVGRGLIDEVGELASRAIQPSAACIVADSNVAALYGARVEKSLKAAGIPASIISFPEGERSKNSLVLFDILERIAATGLTRSGCVIALGGGVTGDMAGLAAALYMRGVPVVQVPTTLLSMVDSSVGGKTAIDLEAGKNLAGAFWQPSLVVADPDVLVTIAPSLLRDSCGEIVKHAAIADRTMLDDITESPLIDTHLDLDRICDIVARNIDIKRAVVEQDERESGLRQTLNFGHTIGHAIEASSNYRLGHGTCVGMGMMAISRASEALSWSEPGVCDAIGAALDSCGLPTTASADADTILSFALHDKKRTSEGVNLAIVDKLGHAVCRHVGSGEFERIVKMALRED